MPQNRAPSLSRVESHTLFHGQYYYVYHESASDVIKEEDLPSRDDLVNSDAVTGSQRGRLST
jgi:hypothetical protein